MTDLINQLKVEGFRESEIYSAFGKIAMLRDDLPLEKREEVYQIWQEVAAYRN